MFAKVNKDLLPFKIVYFLKNGGASFLVFIPPIASQRGISSEGIGIIYTVTPLISSSFNVFVGYCSDKWKIHRFMLIFLSIFLALSYTGYFFLPSLQPISPVNISIPSQYICEDNLLSITLCPDNKIQEDYTNGNITSCNTLHETLGERIYSDHCQFKCKTLSNESCYIDKTLNITFRGNMIFEKRYICQENECFLSETVNISDFKYSCNQFTCKQTKLLLNCEGQCRNQKNEENISSLLTSKEFLLSALCIMTLFMAFETSNSLTDAMCFVALGEKSHAYGKTRLFGTLSWGLVGGAMGLLVNIASKGHDEMNYTPAMIISSFFLFLNVVFTSRINVVVPGRQENSNIRKVLLSFRCIFLLATAFIMGAICGIVWTFEFIYIKDIAFQWDPDFANLNLLFGLIVLTDCIIGETPSLILSGYIIKKLTNIHTFSLTLTMMSVRLLLYGVVSNPWMFLPVHLTHGISVGVFFTNMITYSHILGPEGTQATMQSVANGCFTIGKASGALLGGVLIQELGGSLTFIVMGGILSFYTILYITINCAVQKCTSVSSEDVNALDTIDHSSKNANATENNARERLTSSTTSDKELDVQEKMLPDPS
ncbi:major facilitator superfamily domain-containing protein 6-like [Palaemon carinicauda]|uniref:major facilitator superfamily domain-containing protein 6-like n=1 Tax=Palaemon carinicauda TaxID=392227 RepID=UPI0035B662D1